MKVRIPTTVYITAEFPDFTPEAGSEVKKTGGSPLTCHCGWKRWHYHEDTRVLVCASCGKLHDNN